MSKLSQRIYRYLPVALQNAAISAFGYGWYKRRFGGVFKSELSHFKSRESFSLQQWHDYQTRELRRVLVHAFETVPYYTGKFRSTGLTADDLKRFELSDLKRLPFLEKEELRKYGTTSLLSASREPGKFFASSGSTGTPVQIYTSQKMHQVWSAGFEARIRHWAGVNNKMARGMIGGRRVVPEGYGKPPYYRYNLVEKQVYFSAYHISAANAPDYLKAIRRYKLDYMTGYAASNYFLARFFDDLKADVPPLKAVITSSEKLTPEMRKMLEKVYHCKCYDSYSGVEDCSLISECEKGSLHISPDIGVVEFINAKGEEARHGELAEMVCTGLINDDQPLIRYRIGDMAILSDEKCTCGREMPVVKEIVGRMEDVVIGKDGREMVRFHGIFIDLPHVKEAQIVQEDYDHFIINAVTGGQLTDAERETMIKRMESQLGKIDLVINELHEIPRGNNGKFKAVISKVDRKKSRAGALDRA